MHNLLIISHTPAISNCNQLNVRYIPDSKGYYAGQSGYGYRSIEAFVSLADDVRTGRASLGEVEAAGVLATVANTTFVTAILEAGRRSLDAGCRPVRILYHDGETGETGGMDAANSVLDSTCSGSSSSNSNSSSAGGNDGSSATGLTSAYTSTGGDVGNNIGGVGEPASLGGVADSDKSTGKTEPPNGCKITISISLEVL